MKSGRAQRGKVATKKKKGFLAASLAVTQTKPVGQVFLKREEESQNWDGPKPR